MAEWDSLDFTNEDEKILRVVLYAFYDEKLVSVIRLLANRCIFSKLDIFRQDEEKRGKTS